jgi:hypothetical protein
MSNNIKPPRDGANNEVKLGDWVTFLPAQVIAWKVMAVQNGGLHTNQGMTPCTLRLVADVTLSGPPGGIIGNILRIIPPGQEQILQGLLEGNLPT